MNEETEALLLSLDAQRDHALGALEGLSHEDLPRPGCRPRAASICEPEPPAPAWTRERSLI
jgi:hypothetical protein